MAAYIFLAKFKVYIIQILLLIASDTKENNILIVLNVLVDIKECYLSLNFAQFILSFDLYIYTFCKRAETVIVWGWYFF